MPLCNDLTLSVHVDACGADQRHTVAHYTVWNGARGSNLGVHAKDLYLAALSLAVGAPRTPHTTPSTARAILKRHRRSHT